MLIGMGEPCTYFEEYINEYDAHILTLKSIIFQVYFSFLEWIVFFFFFLFGIILQQEN